MDILTHTVSGLAVGSVVASFVPQVALASRKMYIIISGALGGFFPDIDAVSLWSKFDGTIGKWLHLGHSGNEIYFGKFWYSHHAFFHSIVAALIVGFVIGCIVYGLQRITTKKYSLVTFWRSHRLIYLAFVLGSFVHLLGDCITPASVWGGVRMFWPFTIYVGGWGDVWWWNNYDIFLILVCCFLLNSIGLIVASFVRFRIRLVSLVIALAAFLCITVQVKSRHTDYAYTGHTSRYNQLEQKSKEEQQRILGTKVYRWMSQLDNHFPFQF